MTTELLLPVGNMQMCLAAVHHGADAIYVGVPFFNARGRSADLSLDELKEMIDLCHLYGVKVNLAFNVVIFEHEFPKVIELLKAILPMGPDAFIVQDLGLARLIREMAPEQRIHASTQMTVTNADAIQLVEDLKIDRFVLGRENSLPEIKLIREQTDKELEVFVHGALCVAYSGQCFTSESLGGRSANRGQCAQSCRLPYELYVDDEFRDLGDKKYLVSPKDLMGIAEVPALKALGVDSFKVEGRLKTPEYVASAARHYRDVLDGGPLKMEERVRELSSTYSRGFFSGWLHGVDHQRLVDGTYSAHRGLYLGTVKQLRKQTFVLVTAAPLRPQQGLLIVGEKESGSRILEVTSLGNNTYEVELLNREIKPRVGDSVYLNSDEALEKELQKTWHSREHQRRVPLKLRVSGSLGQALELAAQDPEGREVRVKSAALLTAASSRPIDEEFLRSELLALGTTVYRVGEFEASLPSGLFIHQRELKELRRELVQAMNEKRTRREVRWQAPAPVTPRDPASSKTAQLNLVLRNLAQVEGLIRDEEILSRRAHVRSVILDFEFGKNYEQSLSLLRDQGFEVGIATTRILKPQEYHNLKLLIRLRPDFILVRNLGALEYLRRESDIPLRGDFSLNVTNSRSLTYLAGKGLETINLSYDLNREQLTQLIEAAGPDAVEVTLHQYMPEFHMEHCVFAAFLSKGSSFRDCGKPCEKHSVKLKDPYGQWHFLKADHECRNTFFKATPQSASFLFRDLCDRGVSNFRLEALAELPLELNRKILAYLRLLSGEQSSAELVEELALLESYGLDQGQLNQADGWQDRKKNSLR
jgi:putative protease